MYMRLFISSFSVFMQNQPLLQIIFCYIVLVLFQTIYLTMVKPINDQRLVGRLEIFNSLYLLVTGYFLLSFTDYEPSIERKYLYGEYYFGFSLGIIGLNILIALIVGVY